jgi:hypothetical protein
MGARSALLDSPDVHGARSVVDLLPTQAVPLGDQGHHGVAVTMVVAFGRRHEPLHLGLGQVLAGPQLDVGTPPRGNCSL